MNNVANKKGRKPVAELHYKNASANLPIRKALTDLSVQFGRSTQKIPMHIKTTECYNINIKIEQIIYKNRAEIDARSLASHVNRLS